MNRKKNSSNHSIEDLHYKQHFLRILHTTYGLSEQDLLSLIAQKQKKSNKDRHIIPDTGIPLTVLSNTPLSSLEAIVYYLRKEKAYSYRTIGTLLHRNPKTLAVTYAVACKKITIPALNSTTPLLTPSVDTPSSFLSLTIPYSAFSTHLSILESIAVYLRSIGFTYAQIARTLRKDTRTIWTVCKRAEQKSHSHTSPSNYPVGGESK